MQMARLLLQAHEKTPAGRIRRGFCMKAQDADFFLRALPNGSRMKNSDLVCCFAFRNCYIYEVSKKRRNRRMKQEQVPNSTIAAVYASRARLSTKRSQFTLMRSSIGVISCIKKTTGNAGGSKKL